MNVELQQAFALTPLRHGYMPVLDRVLTESAAATHMLDGKEQVAT